VHACVCVCARVCACVRGRGRERERDGTRCQMISGNYAVICSTFWYIFRCICKIVKRDCWFCHVCPSVCLCAFNNSDPAGRIFMKFDNGMFFENLSRKFKFHSNLKRIRGILYED